MVITDQLAMYFMINTVILFYIYIGKFCDIVMWEPPTTHNPQQNLMHYIQIL